jgi:hypothetical protein
MRCIKIAAGAVILSFSAAQASTPELPQFDDPRYLTLGAIETTELIDFSPEQPTREELLPSEGSFPSILDRLAGGLSLGTVTALGRQIWKIVEANQPVMRAHLETTSVVPQGISDWKVLEGWSAPKSRLFRSVYRNLYGAQVVRFDYRVIYTAGGSYNGHGKYLARISVVPAHVTVAWGYTFNAEAHVPVVTNEGSQTNPIAAAQIDVQWSVDTAMRHYTETSSYYVSGDGTFSEL